MMQTSTSPSLHLNDRPSLREHGYRPQGHGCQWLLPGLQNQLLSYPTGPGGARRHGSECQEVNA